MTTFTTFKTTILSLCVGLLATSGMGCRATAAPDAGFLDKPQLLQPNDKLPFDDTWLKSDANLLGYKKVYVAPVDTTHLLKLSWWERAAIASGDQQDWAKDLADYYQQKMVAQFADDDANRYQVVGTPDDETLIIELAIVEVVPTKVWLNAIGYATIGALDQGATAFEGRFRDGKTKEVIAEFKDREFGQLDLISVRDLEWDGHSRHTIRVWTDDLEDLCYLQPGQAIAPVSTVTLLPW
jgi:hypothetical protein